MKILQICNRVPMPPNDGGSIAMFSITKGLVQAGEDVMVFALNPLKSFINPESIPSSFRICQLKTASINTNLNIVEAFISLLKGTSYNIVRFDQQTVHQALKDLLEKETFDIIHLESIFVSPLLPTIRKYSNAKVILRSHNVEHRIWEALSKKETNPIKSWYLNILSKRLRKYEENILKQFDGILAISHIDLTYYQDQTKGKIQLMELPTGIDLDEYPLQPVKYPKSVCYIGAMDWKPNVQGVDWFLESVWNKTYQFLNGSVFYLAGKKMPDKYTNMDYPNVITVGEVPDPKAFLSEHFLMVVPLFAGSGIRIKILEGMALGKPIIAHYHAANGINFTQNKNILVAYNNVDFSEKIIKCMDDPDFAAELGRKARLLIEEEYDNKKLIAKLISFYKSLL